MIKLLTYILNIPHNTIKLCIICATICYIPLSFFLIIFLLPAILIILAPVIFVISPGTLAIFIIVSSCGLDALVIPCAFIGIMDHSLGESICLIIEGLGRVHCSGGDL